MPSQDQLTRAERIRLEALAQAIASQMTLRQSDFEAVLRRAERIEEWLKLARPDG